MKLALQTQVVFHINLNRLIIKMKAVDAGNKNIIHRIFCGE